MFAREVNENAAMKDVLADAILFNVDCEKGEGPEIAEKYGIRGFPTYIAMNGQGEVSDSWIGYEGPEKWVASVEAAKKDPRTIVEKTAAFVLGVSGAAVAAGPANFAEALAQAAKEDKVLVVDFFTDW